MGPSLQRQRWRLRRSGHWAFQEYSYYAAQTLWPSAGRIACKRKHSKLARSASPTSSTSWNSCATVGVWPRYSGCYCRSKSVGFFAFSAGRLSSISNRTTIVAERWREQDTPSQAPLTRSPPTISYSKIWNKTQPQCKTLSVLRPETPKAALPCSCEAQSTLTGALDRMPSLRTAPWSDPKLCPPIVPRENCSSQI